MSEQQPASGSDDTSTIAEPDGSWSANGTEHEDAITAAPESAATDTDAIEAPAATAEADAAAGAATPDDPGAFLSELVRAMQTTAGTERARIIEQTDRRREEHLAAIKTRREAEAQKMRDLADDDLKAIDGWAEDERQRIQLERERRAGALTDNLQKSLAEHGARIDGEIEGVEAAIVSYRMDVDAFFVELDRETDPVAIAQHASRKPVFPDLHKAIDGDAPSVAVVDGQVPESAGIEAEGAVSSEETTAGDGAEPDVVPVMDSRPGAGLAASFAKWSGTRPAVEADSPSDTAADSPSDTAAADDRAESEVRVAVAHGANDNGPGTILHAVPSGRPLSWLRRGGDSSDRPNEDR
jgi:hypothetical protein